MSHQVPWSKIILETFIQEACLTKDEEIIMRTRVKGWTRTQQAIELGMSLRTVDRCIDSLKKKYDAVQKYEPLLPPRRTSEQEKYMDEH